MNRRNGLHQRTAAGVYESHHGPNMTPMVDVVMVILVFFMASAAVLGPEWFVRSALPVRSQSASDSTAPTIQIKITLSGTAAVITTSGATGGSERAAITLEAGADLAGPLASLVGSIMSGVAPAHRRAWSPWCRHRPR
jgi:biopolymer transport protein ExbD